MSWHYLKLVILRTPTIPNLKVKKEKRRKIEFRKIFLFIKESREIQKISYNMAIKFVKND